MPLAFVLLKPDTLNMCFFGLHLSLTSLFVLYISHHSVRCRCGLCVCLRRQILFLTQREHKQGFKNAVLILAGAATVPPGLPGLSQSHHLHLPTHFLEGLQLPPCARRLLFLKVCEPDIKTGFYISLNATILPGWAPGIINHLWDGANMLAYKGCADQDMNNMRPDQVTQSQSEVRGIVWVWKFSII